MMCLGVLVFLVFKLIHSGMLKKKTSTITAHEGHHHSLLIL